MDEWTESAPSTNSVSIQINNKAKRGGREDSVIDKLDNVRKDLKKEFRECREELRSKYNDIKDKISILIFGSLKHKKRKEKEIQKREMVLREEEGAKPATAAAASRISGGSGEGVQVSGSLSHFERRDSLLGGEKFHGQSLGRESKGRSASAISYTDTHEHKEEHSGRKRIRAPGTTEDGSQGRFGGSGSGYGFEEYEPKGKRFMMEEGMFNVGGELEKDGGMHSIEDFLISNK